MRDRPSQPPKVIVRAVAAPQDLRAALQVRLEVFVSEQGVPPEEEVDLHDLDAVHFVAVAAAAPVGAARVVRLDPATARIGRVAVRSAWRGQGVGRALMEACHQEAGRWARTAVLDAQAQALGFYQSLGYRPEGEPFLDCCIEHLRMRRHL